MECIPCAGCEYEGKDNKGSSARREEREEFRTKHPESASMILWQYIAVADSDGSGARSALLSRKHLRNYTRGSPNNSNDLTLNSKMMTIAEKTELYTFIPFK